MIPEQLIEKVQNALIDTKLSNDVKAKIHDLIQSPDAVTEKTLDKVIGKPSGV